MVLKTDPPSLREQGEKLTLLGFLFALSLGGGSDFSRDSPKLVQRVGRQERPDGIRVSLYRKPQRLEIALCLPDHLRHLQRV